MSSQQKVDSPAYTKLWILSLLKRLNTLLLISAKLFDTSRAISALLWATIQVERVIAWTNRMNEWQSKQLSRNPKERLQKGKKSVTIKWPRESSFLEKGYWRQLQLVLGQKRISLSKNSSFLPNNFQFLLPNWTVFAVHLHQSFGKAYQISAQRLQKSNIDRLNFSARLLKNISQIAR